MQLSCVRCFGQVTDGGGSYLCAACGEVYAVRDGVVSVTQADYFYNTIPRAETQQFLTSVASFGWEQAFYQLQADRPRDADSLFRGVLGFARAGWKYLLPLGPSRRALDIGCGWGAISLALARSCGEVASMDMTRERLRSLRSLADLLGMTNMTFVHGGDGMLPFPDGHFDVIVLNGVLEWVPENRAGRPRDVQVEFLREVARLLSPDGVVYVAIENRVAARYLRKREDHTSLYWSSFLPRPLADLYSRLVRKQPYRTYTYSSAGYRRLFRDAGLSSYLVCPLPNYRFPTRLASLEEDARWPKDGGLATTQQHFAHSFSVLGSKSPRPPALHDVLEAASSVLGESPVRCDDYRIGASAVRLTLRGNGPRYMCRLPYGEGGSAAAARNAAALAVLRENNWNLGVNTPRPLGQGSAGRDDFFIEDFVEGTPSPVAHDGTFLGSVTGVPEFCSALGRASRGTLPGGALATAMQGRAAAVSEKLLDQTLKSHVTDVTKRLVDAIGDTPCDTVWSHGAFGLDRCRWSAKERRALEGVVGWGDLDRHGLPGWDMVAFIADARERTRARRHESALAGLLSGGLDGPERALWLTYARAMGLGDVPTPVQIGTWWLKSVDDYLARELHHLHRGWIERHVRPVVGALDAALRAGSV